MYSSVIPGIGVFFVLGNSSPIPCDLRYVSNSKVSLLFRLVGHDEYEIEPGKQEGGIFNLVRDISIHIEPAIFRVCCTKEGTA